MNAITAIYAISHRTAVGRGVEIAKGMVTGEAPNVQKLREISQEELQQCEFIIFLIIHVVWLLTVLITFQTRDWPVLELGSIHDMRINKATA